jgi:glycosyltransferase involved in cell wall biosynthesis
MMIMQNIKEWYYMKNKVLVSIVVPIYNVEKYLIKCVNSLVDQSYKNIEIILVDDGSKDKCPAICDELMQHDFRIKVIHKGNMGLSHARNIGIRAATGEYILFVDSDDFIHPDMVKDLLFLALKYDSDIVECGVRDVMDGENVKWQKYAQMHEEVYNHEEALEKMLDYRNCRIVAWNKLYKLKLFVSIKYPVGKIHEDEFITPYLVDQSQNYITTHNQYYAYVKRNNSIMRTKFNINRMHAIEAHEERLACFSKKYKGKYDTIIKYHYFVACAELKYAAEASGQNAVEMFDARVGNKYKDLYYYLLHSTELTSMKKLKIIFYRYALKLAFGLKKLCTC